MDQARAKRGVCVPPHRENREGEQGHLSAETVSGTEIDSGDFSIAQLRQFFEILDRWDRQAESARDRGSSSTNSKAAAGGA